jgi:hypothetical protein
LVSRLSREGNSPAAGLPNRPAHSNFQPSGFFTCSELELMHI